MLNLKKIAITGDIASGKSTVSDYLRSKNAYIVNADEIGHQLLIPQTTTGQQIIDLLGNAALTNGNFDRKKIAAIVFANKDKLQTLEKIIHPLIIQEIEVQYEKVKKDDYSYFIVDIPLLFEMKQENFYDFIILMQTLEKLGKMRFENRGFAPGEYRLRQQNLLPIEKKKNKADYIINNNKSVSDLYDQVEKFIQKINQN